MPSLQKARSLVYSRCWESFFPTSNFQTLCRTPEEGDPFQYTANTFEVEVSAASGCNWCRLVLSLKDGDEELTVGQGHFPNRKFMSDLVQDLEERISRLGGIVALVFGLNGASYFLTAFTTRDNLASDIVSARELEHLLTSPMAFDKVKKWLQECSSHENCRIAGPTQLPSRVIEVSSETIQVLHGCLNQPRSSTIMLLFLIAGDQTKLA
jgi:hypothetical protein